MKMIIDGSKGLIEDNSGETVPAFADSVEKTIHFTVTPDQVLEAAQYVIDHLVKEASNDAVEP